MQWPERGVRTADHRGERARAVLLGELRKVDPERAARLHPADKKRIVRAMEVYILTGKTITQHDAETRAVPPRYDAAKIALDRHLAGPVLAPSSYFMKSPAVQHEDGEARRLVEEFIKGEVEGTEEQLDADVAAAKAAGKDVWRA